MHKHTPSGPNDVQVVRGVLSGRFGNHERALHVHVLPRNDEIFTVLRFAAFSLQASKCELRVQQYSIISNTQMYHECARPTGACCRAGTAHAYEMYSSVHRCHAELCLV